MELLELEECKQTKVATGTVVTAYPVSHESGAPSYALRVQSGEKVVAYSGDTEWDDALIEVACGADVFICEAYFYDKRVRYHLDYRTLMRHRPELDCKRIVLTHMSGDMLNRRSEVDFECAEDGQEILL